MTSAVMVRATRHCCWMCMQIQLSMYLMTQRPGVLSGQVNTNVSVHTAKPLRAQKLKKGPICDCGDSRAIFTNFIYKFKQRNKLGEGFRA